MALEGFPEEDAAEVLDCDLATLRGLVEESGRELAAEIATDVLIIEDEPFIAMDIEALVESLGHNVIGIARTHAEALALAKKKRPGLILADIQLADGSSGLDAVNELLGYDRGAGDFHHRFPGAFPHRAAAGAGVPHRQAVPARRGIGRGEPGAVLRPQGAAARTAAERAASEPITLQKFVSRARAARSGALQTRDLYKRRFFDDPGSAVHRFTLHRIRETQPRRRSLWLDAGELDYLRPFFAVARDHRAQRLWRIDERHATDLGKARL